MLEREWKVQSQKLSIHAFSADSLPPALWLERVHQEKTSCTIHQSSHLRASAHSNHTRSALFGKGFHVAPLRAEVRHVVSGRFSGRTRGISEGLAVPVRGMLCPLPHAGSLEPL